MEPGARVCPETSIKYVAKLEISCPLYLKTVAREKTEIERVLCLHLRDAPIDWHYRGPSSPAPSAASPTVCTNLDVLRFLSPKSMRPQ